MGICVILMTVGDNFVVRFRGDFNLDMEKYLRVVGSVGKAMLVRQMLAMQI